MKTLQRFMKGEVRTIDMQVGFLAQFVQKVSKEDPTPRLGAALSAFYSSQDKIDWAGAFTLVEMQEHERGEDRSKIEITRDHGVWRVKEVGKDRSAHRVYDGALTSSGPAGVMVLKDRLNGSTAYDYCLRGGPWTLFRCSYCSVLPRDTYAIALSSSVRKHNMAG